MSASLDDLEPYELFQQELEEYLRKYKNEALNSGRNNQLYIIHTFIEYFCFINPKTNFNEIIPDEITNGLLPYTTKKYNYPVSKNELKSSLLNFFNFINPKLIKLPEELINHLNTL